MKLNPSLAVGLVLFGSTAAQENAVNETALADLSPCVMQRLTQVLSKYNCSLADSCFCDNDQLSDELTTRFASCPYIDQLATIHFQASTCKIPVQNIAAAIESLFLALSALTTMFTISRIISRLRRFGGAGFGWDDAAATLSDAPLLAVAVCNWHAIHAGGAGIDIWALNLQNVHEFVKWTYLTSVVYTPVLFITKASLILLYLRVWPSRSTFRTACLATLGLLFSAGTAFLVAAILQCRPVGYQWTRITDPGSVGTCVDREAWLWCLAITIILFDLTVLLLPIPNLLSLQVPGSRKVGVIVVFSVGIVVTAFSFVRLRYIHGFTTRPNPTRYDDSHIGIYSNIEAHLGQICCCMPTIPGLVRRTYHYATGKTPSANSNSASSRSESKTTTFEISDPIAIESYDDENRSIDKFSLTASGDTAAPAPIVPRPSNPFLHHSDNLAPGPSSFMKH